LVLLRWDGHARAAGIVEIAGHDGETGVVDAGDRADATVAIVEILVLRRHVECHIARLIVSIRRGRGLRAARRDNSRDTVAGTINPGGRRQGGTRARLLALRRTVAEGVVGPANVGVRTIGPRVGGICQVARSRF
jgi:hypothetical protein